MDHFPIFLDTTIAPRQSLRIKNSVVETKKCASPLIGLNSTPVSGRKVGRPRKDSKIADSFAKLNFDLNDGIKIASVSVPCTKIPSPVKVEQGIADGTSQPHSLKRDHVEEEEKKPKKRGPRGPYKKRKPRLSRSPVSKKAKLSTNDNDVLLTMPSASKVLFRILSFFRKNRTLFDEATKII